MPTNPEMNSLDELARRIRALQQAVRTASSNALESALEAGDVLIEARRRVSAGWGRWLIENCAMGVSTALLYIQLAQHREKIEAEIERAGEFSIRAARRLIAKPKASASAKPKPPKTEVGAPDEKLSAVLRKALSLMKTANTPGTSAAVAESNQHEALAALRQLVALLVSRNLDPSDVTVSAAKAGARSHRRAA